MTDISEEEITNGIIKVAQAEAKTVYFVEGHGEPSVDDNQQGASPTWRYRYVTEKDFQMLIKDVFEEFLSE